MSENFGWAFWEGAEVIRQESGVILYAKEGFYCLCSDETVEPGDADSIVTGVEELALRWFYLAVVGD